MKKLIYVLEGGNVPLTERRAQLAEAVVPTARDVGASQLALLIPDLTDEILERNAARIQPGFERVAAAFECWLPSLDDRAPIEEALRASSGGAGLWGYLVTESTVASLSALAGRGGARSRGDAVRDERQAGPRRASMTSTASGRCNRKLSFALHPLRESYIRNAVARRLTAEAPLYLAIVYERFPSMDVFTDDARYAGDRAVVKEVFDHLPTFWEPSTAIVGALSEYRFA